MVVHGRDGAQEVLNPLAALEPAHVEQLQRSVAHFLGGLVDGSGGVADERIADAEGLRQPLGAVKALVETQDVAAGPQQEVGMAQRVALHLERHARREVGRIKMAVEDRADLGGRVYAHREQRSNEPRIERRAGLRQDEAFAKVVGDLHEVGTAVGIALDDGVEELGAVPVKRRVIAAEGYRVVVDEPVLHTGGEQPLGIPLLADALVGRAVTRHGEDRHLTQL